MYCDSAISKTKGKLSTWFSHAKKTMLVITRRSHEKAGNLPVWLVNKDYEKKRTICPFKIKQTLPEQKIVNITKNGQIVKTINVRRKSKYFNGKHRLIF